MNLDQRGIYESNTNKSPKKKQFATPEEESVFKFEQSKQWVGAKLKNGEVQKFVSITGHHSSFTRRLYKRDPTLGLQTINFGVF